MATQVQNRRGTTAEHSTFTGAVGELTVDTTKDTVVVHDGAVAGGRPLLREDQSNLPTSAPTTGIYNDSGSLTISTGGSGRLFVDASGNVGLNVNPPTAYANYSTLSINGSSGSLISFRSAGTMVGEIFSTSSALKVGTNTGQPLVFETNGGAERLRITSAGLVGVGTSAPSNTLHVNSGAVGTSTLLESTGSGSYLGIKNSSGQWTLGATTTSFILENSGGTALTVDSSRRVGIGTSSPAEALEVAGKARILNNTGATNTGDQTIVVVGSTTSGAFSSTYGAGLQFQITNSSGGYSGARIVSRLNADNNTANLVFQSRNYGFSDAMTLDSSGRLGIGTTSPGSLLTVSSASGGTLANITNTSDADFQVTCTSGVSTIGPTVGQLAFRSVNSERGRFDASGRFLVGTSSARRVGIDGTLQIEKAVGGFDSPGISVTNNDNSGWSSYLTLAKTRSGSNGAFGAVLNGDTLGEIGFRGSSSSSLVGGAGISALVDGTNISATSMPTRLVFSTTADGASSPTERMRIRSNGEILLGGITSIGTYNQGVGFGDLSSTTSYMRIGHNSTGAAFSYITFGFNTGDIGNIAQNSAGTAVSYNTTSDYRLKENVTLLTGATNRLKQLPVHRFNFIADPENTVDGFLAHEAQAVVPECVTGEKDAVDDDGNPVYQGIDQSKLVPLLTAALQEAIAEIETLKARLTAAGI